MAVASASWTTHNNMRIKLTDLPLDVVHIVIAHCMDHRRPPPKCHSQLDHNGIGPMGQKPRPHQEDCAPYAGQTSQEGPSSGKLPEVSWPEGLPSNPLVSLSLVSCTFRQCAQEKLFQNVRMSDQCQAYLFLRTLTRSSIAHKERMPPSAHLNSQAEHNAREGRTENVPSSEIKSSAVNELARQVRSIQFGWQEWSTMGLGGGSLICDILRNCPLLKNIAIDITFYECCKEPMLKALESLRHIKEFVILSNAGEDTKFLQWQADEIVNRLFSKWDLLETVELDRISFSRPDKMIESVQRPIPTLNCALRTIILHEPQLDEGELSWMLKSAFESMRTLTLITSLSKIDRAGLCRILKECTGPNLESLTLVVYGTFRTSKKQQVESPDDPNKNPGLLDIVFKSSSALRNLKSLSIKGDLVGSEFLNLLPQSIVKLGWSNNGKPVPASRLAKVLSNRREKEGRQGPPEPSHSQPNSHSNHYVQWLPNLKCFSVGMSYLWSDEKRRLILKALKARRVCHHGISDEEDSSDEEMSDSSDPPDGEDSVSDSSDSPDDEDSVSESSDPSGEEDSVSDSSDPSGEEDSVSDGHGSDPSDVEDSMSDSSL
ncbi:hypothetical protein PtA15_18A180 [Puccinia triticina]|uniref:F-box domain-containing protein n=1 Tax=Puccinia triticina TaxID=208348 RepID=A0ABY7D9X9_9BASI|nr:uncharacterized protein PtA15_18A180 [Puccinia triticina]WAQ93122.1 hypothetical protein PtA15_18A180 [Puccinia triticina]